MLGPLPTFYKVVVAVCTFLAFLGVGVWAAVLMPDTVLAPVGTGLGAGLGVVAAFLLLHAPDNDDHRRVRVRAPRH